MIDKVIKESKDIHSVSEKEGRLLAKLAQSCVGSGVIVEIGSWKGYSTLWLAKGSLKGRHIQIFAIDPHTGSAVHHEMYGEVNTYDMFINNITKAGVSSLVEPIKLTSVEAQRIWQGKSIELLWIDGDHEATDKDFELWYPYLINSGIIALHDTTTWLVPRMVALEKIYQSGNFCDIDRVGSITFARKTASLSEVDKRRNKLALQRRMMYQALLPTYNRVLGLGAKILGRA
jgi:predicted O-methyltransferase YrrM